VAVITNGLNPKARVFSLRQTACAGELLSCIEMPKLDTRPATFVVDGGNVFPSAGKDAFACAREPLDDPARQNIPNILIRIYQPPAIRRKESGHAAPDLAHLLIAGDINYTSVRRAHDCEVFGIGRQETLSILPEHRCVQEPAIVNVHACES